MSYYLRKSYFKTASLIYSSCKSSALLCGFAEDSPETIAAEEYGYHLGMAYQVIDDVLDFTGASATLDPLGPLVGVTRRGQRRDFLHRLHH